MFRITSCPSIHLFIHEILSAMVCLSPLLPNLQFPFGEDVLQADDIKQQALPFQGIQCVCHVSCLTYNNIYTWTVSVPPCLRASDAILIFILGYCALATAWPIYKISLRVISCHAIVRSLSQQIRYIVSLNVLNSAQAWIWNSVCFRNRLVGNSIYAEHYIGLYNVVLSSLLL